MNLENSPNSDSFFFLTLEKSPNSRVEFGDVWKILQIRVQNLQTHSFLKKIQTQRLSLENSPNSMVENSPNSVSFSKTPATLNPKLNGQTPAAWN